MVSVWDDVRRSNAHHIYTTRDDQKIHKLVVRGSITEKPGLILSVLESQIYIKVAFEP